MEEISKIGENYSYTVVARNSIDIDYAAIMLKSGPHYLGNTPFVSIFVINVFDELVSDNKNIKNISITSVLYDKDNIGYYNELIRYIYDRLSPIMHFEAKRTIGDNVEYITNSVRLDTNVINRAKSIFTKHPNMREVGFRIVDSTSNNFSNININVLPISYRDEIVKRISLLLDKFFKYEEETDNKGPKLGDDEANLDNFILDNLCDLFVDKNNDDYVYSVSVFNIFRDYSR